MLERGIFEAQIVFKQPADSKLRFYQSVTILDLRTMQERPGLIGRAEDDLIQVLLDRRSDGLTLQHTKLLVRRSSDHQRLIDQIRQSLESVGSVSEPSFIRSEERAPSNHRTFATSLAERIGLIEQGLNPSYGKRLLVVRSDHRVESAQYFTPERQTSEDTEPRVLEIRLDTDPTVALSSDQTGSYPRLILERYASALRVVLFVEEIIQVIDHHRAENKRLIICWINFERWIQSLETLHSLIEPDPCLIHEQLIRRFRAFVGSSAENQIIQLTVFGVEGSATSFVEALNQIAESLEYAGSEYV